jgi:uncharacterized membrane protein
MRGMALWASLAANVFFAGLVGSHLLLHRASSSHGLDGFVGRLAAGLSPPDAARFRGVLDRERPWYGQAHAAVDRARARLADSIARQPYDEGEVRQRLQDWRARWGETSDRFGESLLVAVRTLSPQGREQLAAALRRPPGH